MIELFLLLFLIPVESQTDSYELEEAISLGPREPPITPLKLQINDDIPISEIICPNPEHVLTERPNLKLVCVKPLTLLKLEWILSNSSGMVGSIDTGGKEYDIELRSNREGHISDYSFNRDHNSFSFSLNPTEDGKAIFEFSNGLFTKSENSDYIVLENGEEVSPNLVFYKENSTIIIVDYTIESMKIEIVGTVLI